MGADDAARSDWVVEHYRPVDGAVLAQELYDSGLLSVVNAVLHPHGLAFGVAGDGTAGQLEVTSLTLNETSDPEGVWYDEALTRRGRQKLNARGLLRRGRVLAATLTPEGRYVDRPTPVARTRDQTDDAIAARERTRRRLEGNDT